jgi:hypothetical protein
MKKIALALLLSITLLPLHAHDILANGDFADGAAHWRGDGKSPSDAGQPDATGLIIQLDPTKWTKISQVFNTRESALSFTITYKTSSDCAFSNDASKGTDLMVSVEDLISLTGTRYRNPLRLKAGSWLLMVNDPSEASMTYYEIQAKIGSPDAQTVTGNIPKLVAHEEKQIFLAFPPGTGTITVTKIALAPTGGAPTP